MESKVLTTGSPGKSPKTIVLNLQAALPIILNIYYILDLKHFFDLFVACSNITCKNVQLNKVLHVFIYTRVTTNYIKIQDISSTQKTHVLSQEISTPGVTTVLISISID